MCSDVNIEEIAFDAQLTTEMNEFFKSSEIYF